MVTASLVTLVQYVLPAKLVILFLLRMLVQFAPVYMQTVQPVAMFSAFPAKVGYF
jgi:hypothetical protein